MITSIISKVKIKMKTVIRITSLFFLLLFLTPLSAKVRLPHLISNGMILQRDVDLKIWGWADSKESIKITFLGKRYNTKADKEGYWSILLPAQKAGGPYDLVINEITIKDVLFGDVWLCSGQSNMELPMHRVLDLYASEVRNISNSSIRYFRMPINYNFNEEEEDYKGGEWKLVTSESVLEFSAVAYFFAKELYDNYHIPIGLINTAVGGTPAEAWVSKEVLKKYPKFEREYNKYATLGYVDGVRKQEEESSGKWHRDMIQKDKGLGVWNKEEVDLSDWKDFYLPGLWKDKGINVKHSVMWFRKNFNISKEEVGQPATLRLGYIIDSDSTFVNGQFVGATGYQYPPRIYQIPSGLLKEGENNITVRIVTNKEGGFKEDKPYQVILPNRSIDLTGSWRFSIGADLLPPPSTTFFQYKSVGLYNGMIAPLNNYKIKGVLWYQGESNSGRAKEYTMLFQDLILDWRKQRNQNQMPFIFAQLPELNKPWNLPSESGLADLREAQRKALEIPYTGMAVTLGLGEWNDIHPLNKKDVAHLLALEARCVAYNEEIVSTGPKLDSAVIEGNDIILTFSSVGSGLYSNDILNGFTIAGKDRKYLWGEAVVLSENEVRVYNKQLDEPISVRYAWADNPKGANLKNKEGLFASPFCVKVEN